MRVSSDVKAVLDAISDGIVIVDAEYRILFMNRALARTFGEQTGQICHRAFVDRKHPCHDCPVKHLLNTGAEFAHHTGRDKRGRWFDVRAAPLTWPDGHAVVLESARDVTDLVETQEQNLRRGRQLSALVEASRAVTSSLEPDQVLSRVVSQAVRVIEGAHSGALLLHDDRTDLLTVSATDGISMEAMANVTLRVGEGVAGRSFELQQALLCNSPEELRLYFESSGQASLTRFVEATAPLGSVQAIMSAPLMLKGNAIGCLALHRYSESPQFQVSDLELLQAFANQAAVAIENAQVMATMERLALTDDLTSLYNRHHFHVRLSEEIGRARRYNESFAILMTDIDDLKRYNDTHGHPFGDSVLRRVAAAARSAVRESDLAFRYGGDEFIFILPETTATVAENVAQRIKAKIKSECQDLTLSLCIGIAVFPYDAVQPEDLVKAADAALYQSKREGRDRICLFSDLPK